jgi:hypothetical protein
MTTNPDSPGGLRLEAERLERLALKHPEDGDDLLKRAENCRFWADMNLKTYWGLTR